MKLNFMTGYSYAKGGLLGKCYCEIGDGLIESLASKLQLPSSYVILDVKLLPACRVASANINV